MKKITTTILSVLLAFAFVLAGCAADKSDITVTIAGEKDGKVSTVYTGAAIVPDITVTPEGKEVTVTYEGTGGTVYESSSSAPVNAGTYAVKISFAGDDETNAYERTVELTVNKAQNTLEIACEDVSFGTAVAPEVVKNTSGGAVTYSYEGRGDTEYAASAAAPTAVGEYTVTAASAATDNYEAATASVQFSISKAQNTLEIACEDVPFGTAVAPEVVKNTSGGTVTYSYEGRDGTEYAASSTAPTAVGKYTVTATSAATDNYEAASDSADFEIIMPPRTDVPTEAPQLKADAPLLDDSFSVVAESDMEYRAVSGSFATEWNASGEFSGLQPATEYTVECRRPATSSNAASAPGEKTLKVTTLSRTLLDDTERKFAGHLGQFVPSEEQNHTEGGSLSYKTTEASVYSIFWPQFFMQRLDTNNQPYNGYWTAGSWEENWIDLSGYRYLSFWIYTEEEGLTTRAGGLEWWSGALPEVVVNGAGIQLPSGQWTRIVLDMTENTYGAATKTAQEIYARVTQIGFGLSAPAIYYLDDFTLLK